jgi:hypothetical protein
LLDKRDSIGAPASEKLIQVLSSTRANISGSSKLPGSEDAFGFQYYMKGGSVILTYIWVHTQERDKWIQDICKLGPHLKGDDGKVQMALGNDVELVIDSTKSGIEACTYPLRAGSLPVSKIFHGIPVLWATDERGLIEGLNRAGQEL